ncbi:MAG: LytR family transcriptional regulator [Calditrichaeota bacterium]|nr:MAG: LytR family transcriptional regulator [Calditrichota bacterium]
MTKINTKKLFLNTLILSLVVVSVFFSITFVKRIQNPPVDSKNDKKKPIEVQVLNGSGTDGLANECRNYLRTLDYDVVSEGNAEDYNFESTIIIDRKGKVRNAEKVAYALNVPYDNVIQQINDYLYLDVTIIIGKDYKSLKPFKNKEKF